MLAYAQKEKGRLIEKRESAARDWYTSKGRSYLSLEKRRNLPDASKPPRGVGLNHTEQGQLKVREQDEWIWTRRLERYEPMVQSVFTAPDVRLAVERRQKAAFALFPSGQAPVKPHHILLESDLNSEGGRPTRRAQRSDFRRSWCRRPTPSHRCSRRREASGTGSMDGRPEQSTGG